jgi:sugar-phosphatase
VTFLCDLDGVLVDSAAAISRAWRGWAEGHGLDPDAVERFLQGRPATEVIEGVAPGLPVEVEFKRVEDAEVADVGGVTAMPGAQRLLATADRQVAVVTSCSRRLALARMGAAGLEPPACLVTADDVQRGKPAPDPYLLAAQRLGVEPGSCIVIEDAPAGVDAGLAAGMTVWAVTTTHTAEQLAGAHRIESGVAALP